MPLIHDTYGKGRVRVMRVTRGAQQEVRELTAQIMLEGDFSASFTAGDNRAVVATDTIKNIAYIVARERLDADAEPYGQALAQRFLDRYPQVSSATVTLHETRWTRYAPGGAPHPHAFLLDGNGRGYARVRVDREGEQSIESGLRGFTFLKSTESGWVDYVMDEYTTLPPTTDRIAATSMDATWRWAAAPASYPEANRRVLDAVLDVFATTYSHSIQDSLYRMGEAALAAVPELADIHMACPNKHYIPVDLRRFDMDANNQVFVATDEPHGQIECRVGRG